MKHTDKASELRFEIKRAKAIIETTQSPYLRRDMEKYLKRLEKQLRYGTTKGPGVQR